MQSPGIVIAVANEKGGVGKTQVVRNLAPALSRILAEKRGLTKPVSIAVIDNDPQSGLTFSHGYDDIDFRQSMYAIYEGQAEVLDINKSPLVQSILLETIEPGVYLAPAHLKMGRLEMRYGSNPRSPKFLRRALRTIRQDYPVTLIDTGPSLGMFTINALVASDYVLIPCETESPSLKGLNDLLETIADVQHPENEYNPKLRILGLLPTKVANNSVSRVVLDYIRGSSFTDEYPELSSLVLNTQMTESQPYRDARHNRRSVFTASNDKPSRRAQSEMMELATEVISKSMGVSYGS